jgi:hypothetical protein
LAQSLLRSVSDSQKRTNITITPDIIFINRVRLCWPSEKFCLTFSSKLKLHIATASVIFTWRIVVSLRQIIAHKSSSSFFILRWSHTSTFTRLDWGQIEFDNLFFPVFSFVLFEMKTWKIAKKKFCNFFCCCWVEEKCFLNSQTKTIFHFNKNFNWISTTHLKILLISFLLL